MANLVNLKTGKTEDINQDKVSDLLHSGEYDLPRDDSFNVINPNGDLVSLPSHGVYDAVTKYGYRIPSNDDLTEFQNKQKYGEGLANETKAFAAGAARSATFGLSDQALTKSGLVNPETLSSLAKYNPNATTAGEVAGVAGSVLAAPEAGLVGGVAKAGEAVTEAAAPVAAKLLGNPATSNLAGRVVQAAGQVGAKVLGSAVEGAAYGVGQSISEQALGDPDLNAEKVMSNVGLNALFGGAIGGVLKAGEIAIPKSVEAAKDAFSKFYDTAVGLPNEEPGALGQLFAKGSSFVSGKSEDSILYGWKNRLKSAVSPDEIEQVNKQFSDGLKDQLSKINKALFDTNKDIRPEETAKYLEGYNKDLVQPAAEKTLMDIKQAIQTMRQEPDLYPSSYPRILELIDERVSGELGSAESAHDVFQGLDGLKKRLDEEISYGATPGPGDQRAQKVIGDIRRSIKQTLENEDLWGQAAARQSAFNDAQAQFLNLVGKKGAFAKDFLATSISKTGKPVLDISPNKIKTFLSQINDVRGETKAENLQRFLDSSKGLLDQIEQSYQSLPEKSFDSDALRDVLSKNQDFTQKAVEQAQLRKTLGGLSGGAHNVPLAETGAIAAGYYHPALGAAIESWSLLKDPYLAMQRLAKIEKAAQSVTNAIEKGTSAVLKAGEATVDATKGVISQKLTIQQRSDKHEKLLSQLNEMSNNPDKLLDGLDKATKDLYSHAPQTAQGLSLSMSRATQFLASKAPQDAPMSPLSPKPVPSDTELATFERYTRIVENPVLALHDIKSGMLSQETMETLQTVYPKLYNEMKQSLMDKISDKIAKNKEMNIPYKTKLAMSLFLGEDLDRSLSQMSIASNQMALAKINAQNQVQKQLAMTPVKTTSKGLGKVTLADRMETQMQSNSHRES